MEWALMDSPLERPGRRVEVEGVMLEEEEMSMTGWVPVRRKGGQVEKVVSAVSRGWEEYKYFFPHRAYNTRQKWSEVKEQKVVKAWLEGKEGSEEELRWLEELSLKVADAAKQEKVEKWLRGGGGM